MSVDYDRHPKTFNALIASLIGQQRASAHPGFLAGRDGVVMTVEATLDLLEVVADLRARVALLEGGDHRDVSR